MAEVALTTEWTGPVRVFQNGPSPAHTIIIISGSEGWKGEVVDLAKDLSTPENLVIGLDYNSYMDNLKDDRFTCPCGDFARLSVYAQREKGVKQYVPPVLIGKGEGAELVYAALAQSPDSFLGGISLGFCPEYSDIRRMCKINGMEYVKRHGGEDAFLPSKNISVPWAALPGVACAKDIKQFASTIPGAQVLLPGKDILSRVEALTGQWEGSYKSEQRSNSLALPLVEYPPTSSNDTLFVILSGDGGWNSLDRDIGKYLSEKGMAVVGFDMLRYLWPNPEPEQGGKDLDRILSTYMTQWKKKQAVLIGYSMGADALAFMTPLLRQENAGRLRGVVLIGPSVKSYFALDISEKKEDLTVGDLLLPKVKKISSPVLCIGGSVERESLCRRVENGGDMPKNLQVDLIHSGHTFHDAYAEICQMISDHFNLGLK